MKKILFITFLLSIILNVTSQNTCFKEGEKLRFVGSYYMSSLWTNLAEITLEVLPVAKAAKPCYHISGISKTFSEWDHFFKIRDSYQSWIEAETAKPLIFKRDIQEGTFKYNEKYIFKHSSLQVNTSRIKKNGTEVKNSYKIPANTFDMISTLYYVRTLNYDKMQINQVIPISVLIDEKIEIINIKYKGTENIKTDKYGVKKCYKLTVNIKNEKIIKYKETNNIWITADSNKVPVLIKAEIPVGSIQIKLGRIRETTPLLP